MITYKLILLLLDFLIEEFKVRIKHNNELYSKYMENFEVSRDFPLFSDDNSEFELICESM
jgi:hypothetical protein